MNSITGKLILSLVRDSDYAHAGEEEAIDLALGPIVSPSTRRWLDVGCGIGGTARYVVGRGWGQVTGIDLDPANIEVARRHHPGLEFVCCDVVDLQRNVTGAFDVIYLLNAFFLFSDQTTALHAMRAVARPEARLVIFDYVDLGGYGAWQVHRKSLGLQHPLVLDQIESILADTGWTLDRVLPANREYLRWYEALVDRIERKRKAIVSLASEDFYDFVLTEFSEIREDVRAGRLGGAILHASTAS